MSRFHHAWSTITGHNKEESNPPSMPASAIPRALKAKPRLTLVAGGSTSASIESRGDQRFVPLRTKNVILTTVSGKKLTARIINVSRTGVALEPEATNFRPTDIVAVKSRPVEPGRRLALGMVFVFKKPLDPKVCNPDLVL